MLINRIKLRIPNADDAILLEYLQTASDRINLRLKVDKLPPEMESIAVEATCALYNKRYHEGISSESSQTFNTSFVDDILAQYEQDFENYIAMQSDETGKAVGKIRFI